MSKNTSLRKTVDLMKAANIPIIVVMGDGVLGRKYAEQAIKESGCQVVWYARESQRATAYRDKILEGKFFSGKKDKKKTIEKDQVELTPMMKKALGYDEEDKQSNEIIDRASAYFPSDSSNWHFPVTNSKCFLKEILPYADIVYYTLGVSEIKAGTRDRNDSLLDNVKIAAEYAKVLQYAGEQTYIISTPNPDGIVAKTLDFLTGKKVITAGSKIDSVRLTRVLYKGLGLESMENVSINDVSRAWIVGNHGPDMLPLFHLTNIGKDCLKDFLEDYFGEFESNYGLEKIIDNFLNEVLEKTKSTPKDLVDITGEGTAEGPEEAAIDISSLLLNPKRKQEETVMGVKYPEGKYGIKGEPFLGHLMFKDKDGKISFGYMDLSKKQINHLKKSAEEQIKLFNQPEIQKIIEKTRLEIKLNIELNRGKDMGRVA